MASESLVKLAGGIVLPERVYRALHRPAIGSGGYQSMLRAIQADLNIDPDPDWISPYAVRNVNRGGFAGRMAEAQPEPQTARTRQAAATTTDPADALDMIRGLIKAGFSQQARDVARQALGIDLLNNEIETDAEQQQEPIQRRRIAHRAPKGYRTVKARAPRATRTRKSPKKVLAGLKNVGTDGRTINAKMRAMFGDDWKSLI